MGNLERFATGSRIGDYVVEGDIGEGYEAVHVLLPRRVRIEVMHPTFAGLKPVAVRMMREACILEALHHPGVPRVFEVGILAEGNRPWVASELVVGERIGVAMTPTDVLALVRDVAGILAYAHDRGIVHRDLRIDEIVRTNPTRGYPIVVTNWTEARADSSELMRADDVFALGTLAAKLLGGGVPARIKMMIDDLLVANPMSRPSAAEVRARAKLILETLDEDEIIEETIELVELDAPAAGSAAPPPIPGTRSSSSRIRWTPALGVHTPPHAIPNLPPIGVLKPRS
jgi:serine/threonine protein kinase